MYFLLSQVPILDLVPVVSLLFLPLASTGFEVGRRAGINAGLHSLKSSAN